MRWKVPWSEAATLAVLYTAVAAWSATPERATLAGWSTLALALAVAWVPRALVHARMASPWPRSVGMLLAASGFAALAIATTVAGIRPAIPVLVWVRAACAGLASALAVALALTLPPGPPRRVRAAFAGVLCGTLVAAGLAARPALLLRASASPAALAFALSLALWGRYARPAPPDERAGLMLPAVGCAVSGVLLGAAAWLARAGDALSTPLAATAVLAAMVGLSLGMTGTWLDLSAAIGRAALAAGLGTAAGLGVALLAPAAAVLIGASMALASHVLLARVLRPDGGRLLEAAARAGDAAARAERVEDLAAAVLDPLRAAARDLRAPAALWVLATETRYAIDVAGVPQAGRLGSQAERALMTWMRARSDEPVFVDALETQQVRRTEVRPVVAAMREFGAFAAVPLVEDGELVGALLVPRGRRRALPTHEESRALLQAARRIAGALSSALALERARARAADAEVRAAEAEDRRVRAEAERDAAIERARGAGAVRALGSLETAWVGYSEAMRALEARARALAALPVPVAIVAEPGSDVAALARLLHDASPHARGACVLFDAASVRAQDALVALVGHAGGGEGEERREAAPGWLERVGDGTLVIEDLPALGPEAHAALLEALKTRRARRVGSIGTYDVQARLVVSARAPLSECGVPAELAARFAQSSLRLPPLRERPEDLEALVLFSVDRACRVAGRAPLGVSREAMAALRGYHWPGNVRELHEALEYAVLRASGVQVSAADLPPQVRGEFLRPSVVPAPANDGAIETYDALERKILEAALERSGGNKSEAARALGLARTTFLDKLRKYGLRA